MFNDFNNEVVFCMKPLFLLLSGLLFTAGAGEVVCSILVIIKSGGYLIGGIYVGAIAGISGLVGFRVSLRKSLFGCIVLYVATLITAVISTVLQSYVYSYVQHTKACSSYNSASTSYTCNNLLGSNYRCYGNSNYYYDAQNCEVNYVNNYGTGGKSCSCVQHDSTCYTFTKVPSCEKFINDLPIAILASYSFAIAVVIISAALLVISVISFGCPQPNSPPPNSTTAPVAYSPAPVVITTTIVETHPEKTFV